MNNIAQFLMLGVGGFVLWQWYSNRQSTGGTTPPAGGTTPGGSTGTGTPPAGGTTPGGSTGTGTPPAGGTTPGGSTGGGGTTPPAGTPQLTVAQITPLAAAGNREWAAVLDQRGIRYNVDQWNWYREQAGSPPIAAEDMEILVRSDEDRQEALLATEYLTRLERLNVGLSGIRWRRSVWET